LPHDATSHHVFPGRPNGDGYVGEHRFVLFGLSQNGRLLAVAHVDRDGTSRIISARIATRHERKQYES